MSNREGRSGRTLVGAPPGMILVRWRNASAVGEFAAFFLSCVYVLLQRKVM